MKKKNKMIHFSRKGKHQTLYTYSFLENDLSDEFIINTNDWIGIGNFGVVLGGQTKSGIPIAVKLIPLDVLLPDENYIGLTTDGFGNICEKEDFLKEIEIANLFGNLNIAPKVLDWKIVDCKEYIALPKNSLTLPCPKKIGVLIMEKFGISLEKYILDNFDLFMEKEKDIFQKIINYLIQIHQNPNIKINVISDIHYGNILIDPDTMQIKLLDLFYPRHSDSEILLTLEESIETFQNKWQDALDYAESLKRK
jgi:hypothetical protein